MKIYGTKKLLDAIPFEVAVDSQVEEIVNDEHVESPVCLDGEGMHHLRIAGGSRAFKSS